MKPIRCALISAGSGLGLWLLLTSLLISNPSVRFEDLAAVDQNVFLLVYRTIPWLLMIGGPIVCWAIHTAQHNPEKKLSLPVRIACVVGFVVVIGGMAIRSAIERNDRDYQLHPVASISGSLLPSLLGGAVIFWWSGRGFRWRKLTRICPYCSEEVKEAATVCKHCGRDIPLSVVETVRIVTTGEINLSNTDQPKLLPQPTDGSLQESDQISPRDKWVGLGVVVLGVGVVFALIILTTLLFASP